MPNDSPVPNDSGAVDDTSKDDRLCLARLLAAAAEASAFAVSLTAGLTGSGGGGGGGDGGSLGDTGGAGGPGGTSGGSGGAVKINNYTRAGGGSAFGYIATGSYTILVGSDISFTVVGGGMGGHDGFQSSGDNGGAKVS